MRGSKAIDRLRQEPLRPDSDDKADSVHNCLDRSQIELVRMSRSPLCFSVNKSATFHGVYLFGGDKGSKYEVTLEVDGAKVTGTYTSECNSEGVYGFNVMLPMTISIEENKIVEMAATIKGPKSYRGSKGKQSVEVNGVIP